VFGLPLLVRVVSHAVKVISAAIATHFITPRGVSGTLFVSGQRFVLAGRVTLADR